MNRVLFRSIVTGLFLALLASSALAGSKLNHTAQIALYQLQQLRSGATVAEPGSGPETDAIVGATASGELDCFVIGSVSRSELEATGARVRSELPNGVFTVFIPIDAVDAVEALAGVQRIEGAEIAESNLDASVPTTGATLFRGPGPTFTGLNGAGIIVGDVDTGVDYKHDNFKDALGNTRFLRIWDETDAGGPPAAGLGYGSEWFPADINGLTAREKDTNGHGSHTMGIAGGDGSADPGAPGAPAFTYTGMAPMADLIMVRGSATGSFSQASLIDGINYIFQQGTAFSKPAVVNMSIGGSFGPHDGSSTFETTVDAMCGPGKTVVFSSGNDGGSHIHGFTNATAGGASTTVLFTGTGTTLNRRFIIDGYYNATEAIDVTVTTPNSTVIGPITFGNNNAAYPGTATANGAVYVENGLFVTSNGSREVYIDVINNVGAGQNLAGTWTFTFTAVSLGAANGRVDQWRYFQSSTAFSANFVIGDDPGHMLVNGLACGQNTLAAGAWVSRQNWTDCRAVAWNSPVNTTFGQPAPGNLATFSSTGPTRDGRWKPEVAAPGTAIASCRSSDLGAIVCGASPTLNLHGFLHVINQGTSMAAPHVTGAVALLWQKYGALNIAATRNLLQTRAVVDGFVTALGAVPNPSFGYGKLFLGDMTDPTCAVTSPNGGEVLIIGTGVNLTWNAADPYLGVTGVDLEISRDNGANWSTVATGIANTGSFPWTVTGPTSNTALLRVTAKDAAGNQGVDLSDAVWAIADQPVSTVVSEFRAEPIDQGVRLVWAFADPSTFTRVALERADATTGPWSEIDADLSQENGATVAVDASALAGHTYFYRLAVTYRNGATDAFGPLSATAGRPITEFALSPISPNPTDGKALIEYAVPQRSDVTVAMFDLQGRQIATLASGSHPPGRYQVTWSGDVDGAHAHAGVYFVRLVSPRFSQTRRVVVSH
jgi:subtilisin family serine protease